MSIVTKSTGAALALAAASMFGCANMGMDKSESVSNDVHCYGVNKCKGHNDCKTAHNACKGHGACKGQGFVSMPKSSCDKLGGEVGA
jgi:uncharacterized membrane protein